MPRGAFFPDDAPQVDVWSLDGFEPSKVIGFRQSEGTFRILVAEGVPEAEVDEISDVLARPRRDR